jgi:enamine deaminase RidA (YjgF/YER057c/UK114 family)
VDGPLGERRAILGYVGNISDIPENGRSTEVSATSRHAQAPSEPPPAGDRPLIASSKALGALRITSGQTAHDEGRNIAEGVVGAEVDLETARRCAWQCARNVVTAAEAAPGGLDAIVSVVRVTVYVASSPSFTEQHLVADAATTYFLEVFGSDIGVHSRAAIGVASLPTGSPVEVEAVFEVATP